MTAEYYSKLASAINTMQEQIMSKDKEIVELKEKLEVATEALELISSETDDSDSEEVADEALKRLKA